MASPTSPSYSPSSPVYIPTPLSSCPATTLPSEWLAPVHNALKDMDRLIDVPIQANNLSEYRLAKDVVRKTLEASVRARYEEAVRSDRRSLALAYRDYIWQTILERGKNIVIYSWDRLPRYYRPGKPRTSIPPKAFLRAKFLNGDSELFERLSLPPLLDELIAHFAGLSYKLSDISDPTISSRWVMRVSVDDEVPDDFECPITHERMKSPTFASDGHTYEHDAIKDVLQRTGVSPLTRENLLPHLVPNRLLLKRMILHDEAQNKRS